MQFIYAIYQCMAVPGENCLVGDRCARLLRCDRWVGDRCGLHTMETGDCLSSLVYACARGCLSVFTCVHTLAYVCSCVCLSVCTCVHTLAYVCSCVCVCVC